MSFYLPRWQDGDRWTRIDPLQIEWVKRTRPRYLPWVGLALAAVFLAAIYVAISALIRSWSASLSALWPSLLIGGIVVGGGLVLVARIAQPLLVGVSDRGVVFGRIGGEAVEWNQLIRVRPSAWGIAIDYPLNLGWWFLVQWSPSAMIWSGQVATRYIDEGQFRAILRRPECPSWLRPDS